MEHNKYKNIISNICIIVIIIVAFFVYRKYDYNFYTKGIAEKGKTKFSRDSNETYYKGRSYKIENEISNDAMFYREISVRPNTPYRVTCMVKTKNVIGNENDPTAGAQICLNGTEEHSDVIQGNTDWIKLEFMFNSKCNSKVEVGFRLGGILNTAEGTAWFSDLEIEEGASDESNTWNFGVFLIDNASVNIEGSLKNYTMTTADKSVVGVELQRLKNSIKSISNNQINIEYEMIEITEPLTTLSYDEENGYYIGEKDVYKLINKYIKQKEFDHIFVCTNLPLESVLTQNDKICEWIGLGNMIYLSKGFSNIRIMQQQYNYSTANTFPEEVFVHEFLHTLERNAKEYGYEVPALHDYEKYNYTDDRNDGLRKWYIDYMNGRIRDSSGNYIGLPEEIYTFKPVKTSDFTYSMKLEKLDEPKNIKQMVDSIIYKIKRLFQIKNKDYNNVQTKGVSE